MSFFKYYSEVQDDDGERLWWPGGPDGFPFRGQNPATNLKKEEFDNLELSMKFRWRLFDLTNAKDAADYSKIRGCCANGRFFVVDKDRWREDKNYFVYLEWVEPAYEAPRAQSVISGGKDAIKSYTRRNKGTAVVSNPDVSRLAGLRSSVF